MCGVVCGAWCVWCVVHGVCGVCGVWCVVYVVCGVWCVWCVVLHLVALLPNVNRVDDANGPPIHSRGVVQPYRVSHQA